MKVIRFFHLRTGGTRGGATVKVVADTDIVGQVDVQAAWCSKKDPYCKETGRQEASKAPIKVVPLRYLPKELGRIYEQMKKKNKIFSEKMPDYTFAIKYFLPKE